MCISVKLLMCFPSCCFLLSIDPEQEALSKTSLRPSPAHITWTKTQCSIGSHVRVRGQSGGRGHREEHGRRNASRHAATGWGNSHSNDVNEVMCPKLSSLQARINALRNEPLLDMSYLSTFPILLKAEFLF